MNENINLVEILKDAPKGTKLWSPLCGECILDDIDTSMTSVAPICVEVKGNEKYLDSMLFFAANGHYFTRFDDGECLLFPSKDNRDWSTFKASWNHKHFEPFQKVLVASDYDNGTVEGGKIWNADLYGHYDSERKIHFCVGYSEFTDDEIIAYEGNEDKLGKQVEK